MGGVNECINPSKVVHRISGQAPVGYSGACVFEETKLIGTTPPPPIPLATRLGRLIHNEPGPAMSAEAKKTNDVLSRVHGGYWECRVEPVAGYNCAGHVWASRRAAIYEPSEWKKIIDDDGYKPVPEKEAPRPGDLAIYKLPDGKIIHIAEVMRIEGRKGEVRKAFALSKWGDLAGEYVHSVDDVPFKKTFPESKVEYWTERLRGDK